MQMLLNHYLGNISIYHCDSFLFVNGRITVFFCMKWASRWLSGKESSYYCWRYRRHRFNPWVGKIPRAGNGNPLQYSCVENFMDRRAWRAAVHGVTESNMTEHTCAYASMWGSQLGRLFPTKNSTWNWSIWSKATQVDWCKIQLTPSSSTSADPILFKAVLTSPLLFFPFLYFYLKNKYFL